MNRVSIYAGFKRFDCPLGMLSDIATYCVIRLGCNFHHPSSKEILMQIPSVVSSIKDPVRDITYQVVAYRDLTRSELVLTVCHFLSHRKRKK